MAFIVQPLPPSQLPGLTQAERGRWSVVLKRIRGELVPWVLLGPSEFLKGLGLVGDGLYALHAFRGPRTGRLVDSPGDTIGNYGGVVVGGPFGSPDSPEAVAIGSQLAQRGGEYLLFLYRRGQGWVLVDGSDAEPPYVPKMNDARSSRNNIEFTSSGNARATKGVPMADLSGSTDALAPSELLASYGASYWHFRALLGSESTPFLVD
mgnify:FL=1